MPVVPIVATTAHASSSVEQIGSHAGTRRRSAPSAARARGACAAFSPDGVRVLGADERRDGRAGSERATIAAASTPVEAVSSMWPRNSSGSPTSCRSQSTRQLLELLERGRRAPEDPDLVEPGDEELREHAGLRARRREVGEEARALPVREPRQEDVVEIVEHGRERLGLVGRRGGQRRADLAGLDLRQDRELAHAARGTTRPSRARARRPRGSVAHFAQLRDLAPASACSGPAPSSATRAAPGRRRAPRSRARRSSARRS